MMNPKGTWMGEREPVSAFGSDRWARDLGLLRDSETVSRLVREASAESGWIVGQVHATEVLKERPSRRRTLRFRLTARRAGLGPVDQCWYGIQYRDELGERAWKTLRSLRAAAASEIRVPTPIGYSRGARLLLVGAFDGRPLSGALEDPIESRVAASLKRLGRALAAFHALRSPAGPGPAPAAVFPHFDARAEAAALTDAERRIIAADIDSRLEERLREGVAFLRAELTQTPEAPPRGVSLVHRDLHPDHVVFGAEGIGLIDLDDAAFGEPELDVAVLVAQLILRDLKRGGPIRLAPARSEALRAGYLTNGTLRPARLATYTSSALIRLAADDRAMNGGMSAPDRARLVAALAEEALPELCRL